jgi:hypothetical protein
MISSPNENGIIPNVVFGYPYGAGSARQAVISEINNKNIEQHMNNQIGGNDKKNKKRQVSRNKRHGGSKKRKISTSNKQHGGSMKRQYSRIKRQVTRIKRHGGRIQRRNSKRKQNKSIRNRIMFYGGLEEGAKVAVPQFGSAINDSSPLNQNNMSSNLNSLMIDATQNSIYDEKINN